MILGTYPATLLEAMAIHTLLEELGYSKADEIFLLIDEKSIAVRLNADGRIGDLLIGEPELSPREMEEKWLALIGEWNTGGTMTREDKDGLFWSSKVWRYRTEMTSLLVGYGFNRWTKKGKPLTN